MASKVARILSLIFVLIMCVLFLIPAQYSPVLLINPTDLPNSTEVPSGVTPETVPGGNILPETSPGILPGTTHEIAACFTPTPKVSATPSVSYYEKYTTPYVGTDTTPKYRREGHHYSISINFPNTYRVENTLYIKVVLNAQLVHVYRRDSKGNPTELVRSMIMSSGVDKGSCVTPLGKFMLMENSLISTAKSRWMHFTNEWAQYTSRLYYITSQSEKGMTGYSTGFLFHSELYREADPTRLIVDEYNTLGYPRSHGCMRLQVKDAKWIYDNAKAGTIVEIVDGKADPATWSKLKPALLPAGTLYDPTDPSKPGVKDEPRLHFDLPILTPTIKPTATPTATPTTEPVTTDTPTETPVATPEVTPTLEPVVTPTVEPTVTPESTEVPGDGE